MIDPPEDRVSGQRPMLHLRGFALAPLEMIEPAGAAAVITMEAPSSDRSVGWADESGFAMR